MSSFTDQETQFSHNVLDNIWHNPKFAYSVNRQQYLLLKRLFEKIFFVSGGKILNCKTTMTKNQSRKIQKVG